MTKQCEAFINVINKNKSTLHTQTIVYNGSQIFIVCSWYFFAVSPMDFQRLQFSWLSVPRTKPPS